MKTKVRKKNIWTVFVCMPPDIWKLKGSRHSTHIMLVNTKEEHKMKKKRTRRKHIALNGEMTTTTTTVAVVGVVMMMVIARQNVHGY